MGKATIPIKEYTNPTKIQVILEDKNGTKNKNGVLDLIIQITPLLNLKIDILEIRNLEPTEITWPDPYVIVKKCDEQVFRSLTHTNSKSCLIDEQFKLSKFPQRLSITFEIWDANIVQDELIGCIEVPISEIVLIDSIPVEKSYPINFDLNRTLTISITSFGISQNSEDFYKKDALFELLLSKKVKSKFNKVMDSRRRQSHLKDYYSKLLDAFEEKDDQKMIKKLLYLYNEVEEKEKGQLSNRTKDEKQEATILFISDLVYHLAKFLLQKGEKEKAREILYRSEKEFPHPVITHQIDKLLLNGRKDYYYKNFTKIHTPENQFIEKYLDKSFNTLVAMFFAKESFIHNPRLMFERVYNESTDKELKGLGSWKITNEIHHEGYFINFHCLFSVSEEFGTVVIAVRGTEFDFTGKRKYSTFIGWATNIDIQFSDYSRIQGTKVHKGFLQQYLSSKNEFITQVEEYLKKGYQIIITGHSQGAAISGIIAMDCTIKYSKYINQIYHQPFAQPRVGNDIFAKYMNEKFKDVQRFYTQYQDTIDFVTTVPPEKLYYVHYGKDHKLLANSKFFKDESENHLVTLHGNETYYEAIINELYKMKE